MTDKARGTFDVTLSPQPPEDTGGHPPVGRIVVGDEYFQMWQSETANGLEPALQNTLLAGLGLLVAHLPSPDWNRESR